MKAISKFNSEENVTSLHPFKDAGTISPVLGTDP